MTYDDIIIGSGPAGISAAQAYVQHKRNCLILDVGNELPTELEAIKQELALSLPSAWDPKKEEKLFPRVTVHTQGIDKKLLFGSDYPYQYPSGLDVKYKNAHTDFSHGRGGFGSVWGSCTLPYSERDLAEWPLSVSELRPGYEAVAHMMAITGEPPKTTENYPHYGPLHPCPQETPHSFQLRGRLESNAKRLQNQGVHFERSRLAASLKDLKNCTYCGQCLFGCVYDVIYNPAQTLAELIKSPYVTYQPLIYLRSFAETAEYVTLSCRDEKSGQELIFKAKRLLLGAGSLATTRIVLQSRPDELDSATLLDGQYSLIPWMSFKGVRDFRVKPQNPKTPLM